MTSSRTALLLCLLFPIGLQSADISELMPLPSDHTSMWWKEGFPSVVEDAPWERCIQTGNYTFVLDTETLQIPHFGPASTVIDQLPGLDLTLRMTVDGKTYRGTSGGPWTKTGGPRLVESGRWFQRGDVTDLIFQAEDGTILNAKSRFETAAWPDRLGLVLAARPGALPLESGEDSFGRVRGGFGLNENRHFEIPAESAPDSKEFTFELWAFIPTDFQVGKTSPWLVCKNHHEQADGNFGVMIFRDGMAQARMNLGGGRENVFTTTLDSKTRLRLEAWNHLAVSYDGDTLRLFGNGRLLSETKIGKERVPVPGAIAIGRRLDNSGDGYRFRGAVDELRLYDRALTEQELRLRNNRPEAEHPSLKPTGEWTFRDDIPASIKRLNESWNEASLEIELSNGSKTLRSKWDLPKGEPWSDPEERQVSLALDPVAFAAVASERDLRIEATELSGGAARPITFDEGTGWHRINLDGLEPTPPPGGANPSNDALERVKLILTNPSPNEQKARLMFEKTSRGIRQRIGTPITGISAMLRDAEGNPTGIPIQLSKNWHTHPEETVYSGQWFHGITQLRLPAKSTTELELTICYGHWGGVAAASHAQLSLIGWGSNQRWDQSALGAWGESICYEPAQAQRGCTIMDVRPLMVNSMSVGRDWGWTNNVGGGDVFRIFDPAGNRVPHASMQADYVRYGPCLTEVRYHGTIDTAIEHSITVSLGRTDDLVRGTYRIRMDVTEPVPFSRFAIFQVGADNYQSSSEKKMAIGDEAGLIREWPTQWGGNVYRGEPMLAEGKSPWISLHEAVPLKEDQTGASANRGIVIRSWEAQLGGQNAKPWFSERGLDLHGKTVSSTIDLIPPPGVAQLQPGDYVEAVIEHIVMPQFATDYYGPNEELRRALTQHENTWRMIHREASKNARQVQLKKGTLTSRFPDIRISTAEDQAEFTLSGGLGYFPITFTGLSEHKDYLLMIDEKPVDQSVHGNDFWQTDFDPNSKTWSQSFTIPTTEGKEHIIRFVPRP